MLEDALNLKRARGMVVTTFAQRLRKRDFDTALRGEIPVLYRVARRMTRQSDDAEELVQLTMISAFKAWERFDGAKIRPWLLKILHNENLARFRKYPQPEQLSEFESDEPWQDDLWQTVLTREQADRILQELERLEPHYKLVIQLCDVEGMTYDEVAEVLDLPVGTVRSRLFRGRNLLRERVIAKGGEIVV